MGIVIIQQIKTEWTKVSRGGENAVKRNTVPEVAKVPVERIKTEELVWLYQFLSYGEQDRFAQSYEEITVNPSVRPYALGCVTIYQTEEAVLAEFRYMQICGGAPDRGWARKTLRMAINEWGQIVYNGRFAPAWDGDWWYEKKVVNVGLFERVTPSVFTREAPTYRFEAMGHLF